MPRPKASQFVASSSQSVAKKGAPKRTLPFTQARVDRMAFESHRAVIYDASQDSPRGFALRVSARSKVYYVLATIRGKGRTWVRVGDAQTVTLKDARTAAWAATGEIARGTDINAVAQRQRAEAAARARPADEWTVVDMVNAYLDARPKMARMTVNSRRWLLKRYIAPNLDMPAREVVRNDMRRAVSAIAGKSMSAGQQSLRLLRTAFRWAMDEEVMVLVDGRKVPRPRIERDPTRRIEDEVGIPRYKPRQRHLSDEEIKTFWSAVETLGPNVALFCRLIVLCGTRSTETHRARWEHVYFDVARWHIPAANRKGRAEGQPGERRHLDVPLSPLAVKMLKAHYPKTKERGRVFVGVDPKDLGPLMTNAGGFPRLTLHDLRRTCSTGLQRIGCPPHVISVVLGHAREEGSTATDAAYTHDRRQTEHRLWLAKWAEHVEGLLSHASA